MTSNAYRNKSRTIPNVERRVLKSERQLSSTSAVRPSHTTRGSQSATSGNVFPRCEKKMPIQRRRRYLQQANHSRGGPAPFPTIRSYFGPMHLNNTLKPFPDLARRGCEEGGGKQSGDLIHFPFSPSLFLGEPNKRRFGNKNSCLWWSRV